MRHALLPLLLLLASTVTAQEAGNIFLTNPSFEDMPRVASPPKGWTDCGFHGESAPDTQPEPTLEFNVTKQAQHQNTYLGMVVRENETYERVGQQMSAPMSAGQCYELRIQLARSEIYLSRSHSSDYKINYVTPAKVRIRGGFFVCDRGEVIGQSELVKNFDWSEYRIKLKPEKAYTHIILEVFYKSPILFPYNGNVLLDNASPLRPVNCDEDLWDPATEEPPVVSTPVNPDTRIEVSPVQPSTPGTDVAARSPQPATPPTPKVKLGKTEGELKAGQVFAIENIKFKADNAELEAESETALQEIAGFLRNNGNVIVEIGGHASYRAGPIYAARISEERAQSVVDYLASHGIGGNRMYPRGYGKSRPVCIDDNPDCNRRNQRVEVKILKIRESR